MKTFLLRPGAWLLFANLMLVGLLSGQQAPPPPAPSADSQAPQQSPPAAQSKDTAGQNGGTSAKGTSNDRIFFALPNFLTLENSAHVPPLTAGQKFKVVARSSFDPVVAVWYGALAGIGQAENSEPGYGQGAEGYGKRYGAAFADGTIENFMTGAIFPSLLRQDPRFFQSGHGGFTRRAGYAVSRIVITRTDSGHRQFNFSEVVGSATAAAISTYSYHPKADRTVGSTASVWGSLVGYDTITIVVREFWPDIRRKLHKKQNVSSGSTAP
ncbi:MAG: hypothetical protein WB952_25415 [Terriglobales bacterium]